MVVLAATLVGAAAVAPIVQIVLRAGSQGWDRTAAIVLRPRTLDLAINTLTLTATVCAISLVLGVAVAYASTRIALPAPRLWIVLACLPLAVPSFVAAFAWASTWPRAVGFWPLVVVLTVTCVPLVTVPTIGAFAVADETLADVARTLGRSRAHAFVRVLLPQVLPAAGAGTLLVALYTIADFGSPALMRHQTLTTGVYALFRSGIDRSAAAAMSLPLAALALSLVIAERRLRARGGRRPAAARRRPPHQLSGPGTALVAAALSLLALAGVGAPPAALVRRSLIADRYPSTASDLAGAAATSLALAAVAASVTVLLALPISHLVARYRSRWLAVVESATVIGYAMPGVVIALALVALSLAVLPFIYQTLTLLIIAYVVLALPLSVGPSRAAFRAVPVSMDEVSRTLGRGPVPTWLRVRLRGALPGIMAGWLLVVADVLKELPATLMLRPIGVETLATELWGKTTLGAYGAAAPIGILLVAVGVVPALILARGIRTPGTADRSADR